jgi:hypothetical protein
MIGRIRREHLIKGIVREVKLLRDTIRKVLRLKETSFSCQRKIQPRSKMER